MKKDTLGPERRLSVAIRNAAIYLKFAKNELRKGHWQEDEAKHALKHTYDELHAVKPLLKDFPKYTEKYNSVKLAMEKFIMQ